MTLGRAIAERSQLVFDQRTPFFSFDAAGKDIGIECRSARQRQDRAAVNIEGYDRPFLAFERLVRGFLHLPVYG